jgi:hypothetical protein
MRCRHCSSELNLPLIDLGSAPPSNAYLTNETLLIPEKWFPLRVLVCTKCYLVQTEDFTGREYLFQDDYAYFSSFSTTWLTHAERYVDEMVARFDLGINSQVVEVAANDGYLLQFMMARKIPCTGVEPTAGTAAAARAKGINILEDFFGLRLAGDMLAQGKGADLMVANNVLAHVPDINDFVAGFSLLLKPCGIATFEFPYLVKLIEENQFDTIYHEHFSYLSLSAVLSIFRANGLSVFDVEEHPTHGGSLRVFAQRSDFSNQPVCDSVELILQREEAEGLLRADYYAGMQSCAEKVKDDFLAFLLEVKRQGKIVAAYGAAAKGNTLMNFAGVRPDLIRYVVDKNPAKQGKYMPGSRVPIVNEDYLKKSKPDYVVIFPWNLAEEVINQLSYIRVWGGRFLLAVPSLKID